MQSNWKNIVKLASVYAGVMLGAGFASGQELIQYFVRFGTFGILGLIVSGLVLALMGWAVMDICVRAELKNYEDFLKLVLGKKLSVFINAVVLIFIMVLFGAMLSATGAMGREAFDLPFSFGVVLMALLCFFTFQFGINAIIKINTILTPVFIVGSIFFILYTLVTHYTPVSAPSSSPLAGLSHSWIWAAVVYASYNVITSISMLANMRPLVDNRKTAKYAGLLGGAIITGLGILFALPLLLNFNFLSRFEIPLLALAHNHGNIIEYLYITLLFSAIYTTAAANGYSVVEWLRRKTTPIFPNTLYSKITCSLVITFLGTLLAHIGFSSLVSNIFPLFGYIGFFEIAVILIFFAFKDK